MKKALRETQTLRERWL